MNDISKTSGLELEEAFHKVLDNFLHEAGFIIDRIRSQKSGTQFGCDIKIDIRRSSTEQPICIHFECKNYKKNDIHFTDILDKPFQAEIGKEQIDLWVLVSPHKSIANDVDKQRFLALKQKFRFPIVLLTPDEGVESLFALFKDSYEKIYDPPTPDIDEQAVIKHWKRWFTEQMSLPHHLQPLTKYFTFIDHNDIISKKPVDQEIFRQRALNFYKGKIPEWKDIASELDVIREDKIQDIYEFTNDTTSGISLALILSEAGAGKSTFLRRVALELSKKGHPVLFTQNLPRSLNSLELLEDVKGVIRLCNRRPVIVCVDNAASVLEPLHYLCDRLQETGETLVLIAADRAARWRAAMNPEGGGVIQERFPSEKQLKLTLGELKQSEISNLIIKLKNAEVSERVIQMDISMLQQEFNERFQGDLLVTLHEIITGQNFDDIIQGEEKEFRSQHPRHKLAYTITATLHQFGLSIPQSLLARLSEGTNDLEAEVSFVELIAQCEEDRLLLPSNNFLTTRHEIVARAVYSGLPETEQEVIFKRIIQEIDSENEDEVSSIIILLTSSDIRREFWYFPFVKKLYKVALEHLPKHSKLYHNAMIYAAHRGDIDLAHQIFHKTPVEYRTPAIIQDIAQVEKRIGNFTEARNIYRSTFGRSGQHLDIQADTTAISSAIDQGKVDTKLLTQYSLFEHNADRESTYPIDLLHIAIYNNFDDAHIHHVLGRILAQQKKILGAISIYSEAEQRFPKSAPFFRLAKANIQPTLEARAEVLKGSIEENVGDATIFTEYALLLKSLGKNEEAQQIFEQGIKADPNDPFLYQTYAHMLEQFGQFDKARELFERGLKADPTDAPLYNTYALMEKELGEFDKARELFERGLKADPTDASLYNTYALMEKELGEFDKARELFERGLKADPTNASLYNTYALMEKELGEFDKARELFERGLKADPTNARLYVSYSEMEAKQKYWRRGLALIQRGITVTNSSEVSLFQMFGRILKMLLRFDQAEDVLHQCLSIDPNQARTYHQLAFVKANQGDKEGTESILREGCSKCRENLLLHKALAQFLVTLERQEEAEPYIKCALEICGENLLQETKQEIYSKPFRIRKPPDFHFISQDQKGIIEKIIPREENSFGFIRISSTENLWFYIQKENIEFYRENVRVLYDLIEYPNRETNRLVAINVELISDELSS
jgi:tetratricopeptide (TPR) repeat protein